jgi:hypothetical protein
MHATKTKNVPTPTPKAKSKAKNVPPPPREPEGPTIGGKIQELINARGLTIYAAAVELGMSRQQLWRIIRGSFVPGGVKDPGYISVQKIVRGLGFRMVDVCTDGDLFPTAPPEDE